MISQGVLLANTSGPNRLFLYALTLLSPPTGSRTVSVTVSGGAAIHYHAANSLTYLGANLDFGDLVTDFGSNTAASLGVSSRGRAAVVMGCAASTTGSFSSLTGNWTAMWNQPGVGSANRPTLIGDGATPTTFGATAPGSEWGALAVPVGPARSGVRFDAVGAGNPNSGGGRTSLSESHNINGGAALAYVYTMTSGANVGSVTCKVGSQTMDPLGVVHHHNDGTWFSSLWAFGLIDPPQGVQTVEATLSVNGFCALGSTSYRNVSAFGTPVTGSGSSSSASMTVPSGDGQMVSQAFASAPASGSGSVSSYNRTPRWNPGSLILIGDAVGGDPSVQFTASATTAWGGIGVPLIP